MGLGYVFSEEIRFEGGRILDTNFGTYRLAKFSQMPAIETVFVPNDILPPKGGGEPAIINMGAVVANAIFDGTDEVFEPDPNLYFDTYSQHIVAAKADTPLYNLELTATASVNEGTLQLKIVTADTIPEDLILAFVAICQDRIPSRPAINIAAKARYGLAAGSGKRTSTRLAFGEVVHGMRQDADRLRAE